MKKGLGIGIEDFKEIIYENCYYIDNLSSNFLIKFENIFKI